MKAPVSEYEEQKAFIKWLEIAHPKHRKCVRLSLNGIPLPRQSAHIVIAMAKKSGMVVSEADLFIAVPAHGYHGVFIEMKKDGGVANKQQLEYLAAMRQMGYAAEICVGAKEAIKFYENYIAGKFGKRNET